MKKLKRLLAPFLISVIVLTLCLLLPLGTIYANSSPIVGIWLEIYGPSGSPPTWDAVVTGFASEANGLTCEISVDGHSTTQPITSNDWSYPLFANGLPEGNYQAKVTIKDGDVSIDEITWDFELFSHLQEINISPDGKTVTWHVTNSKDSVAGLGVSRYLPDYQNFDTLWLLVDSNDWTYSKTYPLTPGTYTSWLTVEGNGLNKDWEIKADEPAIIISEVQQIEKKPPVRTHEMTCWQIFVNKKGNFEFIFFWEYYNNNWVKIYDMTGNEVFSIDFPHGNPRFEVNLPDGIYTVKTFHNGFEKPIQEFLIGKP